MPNENSKPVIHHTSTMKAVLKLTKVLDPPLQNHYLGTQVHRGIAAENLCHLKTDQEEYGMKPYFDENFDENYGTYS